MHQSFNNNEEINKEKQSNENFSYTYIAPTEDERRTINEIRKQYVKPILSEKEDKIERLKALDQAVKGMPRIVSIIVGIIGILVFGTGLAMVLEWEIIFAGVIVALVGAVFAVSAKFIHDSLFKRNKKKYASEIIRLSEELLNEKIKN